MSAARPTVGTALRAAMARLDAAGIDLPRLDAEVLLAHALGGERSLLITARDRPLAPQQEELLAALIERRAGGDPVAYVIGEREFYSLAFAVDPRVLIPRPETEGVVDAALDAIQARRTRPDRRRPGERVRVVDVGTGSGAIAVTLAAEARRRAWPEVSLAALDRSRAALQVARANVARHAVQGAVALLAGDLLGALRTASVDVVAANPPYLSDDDLASISTEVAREPVAALLGGGKDGAGTLRELVSDASRVLRPGGFLVTEIGATQGASVADFARGLGFVDVRVLPDLAGLDRVVVARWSGGSREP